MGSGASTADPKKRIEEVEKHCAGKKIGSGKDGLDEMKQCSEELKVAMDAVAEMSSPDLQLIDRIGLASDIIFSNLDSRINLELVQLEDASEIYKVMIETAENLDKCRASPIAPKIKSKWKEAEQGKYAILVRDLAELVKGVSDIAKLPEALDGVVQKMDALLVGVSKDLAEKALVQCSGFSTAKFQKGFPGLLQKEGPELLEQVRSPIAQFDTAGKQLSSVAEGSWEDLAPTVEKLTAQVSSHMVKLHLQQAAVELAQDHFAESQAPLAQMQRWWPHSQGSDDHAALEESLAKVFALADERALAAEGDISDFVTSLDELRSTLSVPGEPLAARRAAAKALGPLKGLEAELAKESEQSLSAMLKSLQEMSATIDTIAEAEGLQATLSSLEEFLLKQSQDLQSQPDEVSAVCLVDETAMELSVCYMDDIVTRLSSGRTKVHLERRR
ncbi:unnamed protein product [Durusdinium trenchii]|uniref:Uncharacterized protein n=1 Tax=Durusdinium trenchii TaxID=1381693 RepID=A0ABP0LZY3_9DINO